MKVSICIPTFRRPESLNIALGALLSSTDRFDEVLVAVTKDLESSTNEVTRHLIEAFTVKGIPVKVVADFSGLCEAKQWFLDTAKNEVLLFMDDDVVVETSYFDLVKYFQQADVGAVSGTLQTPLDVGYQDWAGVPIDVGQAQTCNTLTYDSVNKRFVWVDKYQVYMHKTPFFSDKCQYLIGTALFVRKDAVEIDMEFQRGACAGEEIDFTYNMFMNGRRLIFDSTRIAWHLHMTSGGMRGMDRSLDKDNMSYLAQKWGFADEVADGCGVYREGQADE